MLALLPTITQKQFEEYQSNKYVSIHSRFMKNGFETFKAEFIINLGHGPKRRSVDIKMPDTLIFFTLLHNQNVTLALDEIESLVRQSNQFFKTKVPVWMYGAMENVRGTCRYYKLQERNHLVSAENPINN
jgi:glycogen debranching enzyme